MGSQGESRGDLVLKSRMMGFRTRLLNFSDRQGFHRGLSFMEENSAAVQLGLCFDPDAHAGDKIIDAAGQARAAFFVRAKSECAGNLPGGRELLCKARVYVCKPDQLAKQSSSRSYEEYSC